MFSRQEWRFLAATLLLASTGCYLGGKRWDTGATLPDLNRMTGGRMASTADGPAPRVDPGPQLATLPPNADAIAADVELNRLSRKLPAPNADRSDSLVRRAATANPADEARSLSILPSGLELTLASYAASPFQDSGGGTGGGVEAPGDSGATEAGGEDDATGTDPRSFSTKFMPYYRYTELKSGLRTNEFVLFGLFRFSDDIAATYEIPVAKNIEYRSVREFQQATNAFPPGQGGGLPPSSARGGPRDLEADGDNVGLGDTILRLFVKNEYLRWEQPFGQFELMPGFQTVVPTATNDVIGGDSWLGAPLVAIVADMPAMGFLALMNFYEFDIIRDQRRSSVERFIGRWFYMQPLTPPQFAAKQDPDIPDLGFWLSGLYLLPEVQPIYDFETDHFSFWVAPEFGKIFWEGRLLYVKPGWGIDQDRFDRQFTMEVGIRWFF